MSLPRVLIIDDLYGYDEVVREEFCRFVGFRNMDGEPGQGGDYFAEAYFCSGQIRTEHSVRNDLEGVIKAVERGWPFEDGGRWALVLIDYEFPTGRLLAGGGLAEGRQGDRAFGKHILGEIVRRWPFKSLFHNEKDSGPSVPCVMFSSLRPTEVEPKVDPFENLGFVQRPVKWSQDEKLALREQIADILFSHGLVEDGALYKAGRNGEPILIRREKPMIGKSLALLRALRTARAAAAEVGFSFTLIQGQKGTGKKNVVSYIHDCSRPGRELVERDLKTIPKELVDPEIFGYEPGAFTGALPNGAPSVFELADKGTVFFDEIGNLELNSLHKLLNSMGSGEYSRLGPRARRRSIECQVICATNKPVHDMVERGDFPDDLFDRFDEASLELPPLQAREGDKRLLFDYFMDQQVTAHRCRPKLPDQAAYDWIDQYPWPGNIREMEKVVKRVIKARKHGGTIRASDLERAHIGPRKVTTRRACEDFDSLLHEIRNFKFPDEHVESVRGALPRFKEAAGELITHMFEVSQELDGVITSNGDINCTGSVRAVLGESMSFKAGVAQRTFNKLLDVFGLDRKNKVIEALAKWAEQQKHGKSDDT